MYRYCYHEVTPEVARLYKEKKSLHKMKKTCIHIFVMYDV